MEKALISFTNHLLDSFWYTLSRRDYRIYKSESVEGINVFSGAGALVLRGEAEAAGLGQPGTVKA